MALAQRVEQVEFVLGGINIAAVDVINLEPITTAATSAAEAVAPQRLLAGTPPATRRTETPPFACEAHRAGDCCIRLWLSHKSATTAVHCRVLQRPGRRPA